MRWLRFLVAIPLAGALATGTLSRIAIDFPEEGSIFPPEISPPAFVWRDMASDVSRWRNGGDAVALALRAVEITAGKGTAALDALAAACAETGRFDAAVLMAHRALLAATPAQAEEIRRRAALCAAHRPFRSSPDQTSIGNLQGTGR